MEFPIEQEPVWIDWARSQEGGFRVVAYTDENGLPHIGPAKLNGKGEMIERPDYSQSWAWRTTAIIDGLLLKFWAVVTPDGLHMMFKKIPSNNWQAESRAIEWGAAVPQVTF